MGCGVELLVMVNTEGQTTLPYGHTQATGLRREEPGRHARHHDQCGHAVVIRHADPHIEAADFRVVPSDRKSDGRRSQDAEVVSVMGVLPDVVAADNEIFSECLLESGVEFVAIPRGVYRRNAGNEICLLYTSPSP